MAGIPSYVDWIVIVDDQGADRSEEIVAALEDPRIELIRHTENQGGGGATLTGYQHAAKLGAEILVKMDADGQSLGQTAGSLRVQVNWLPTTGWSGTNAAGRRLVSVETLSLTLQPGAQKIHQHLFSQPPRAHSAELLWINTGTVPVQIAHPSWKRAGRASSELKKATGRR
ncbi:MAG: hypothetical protein CSA62_11800 [Planctomycetota bacterium]|nr:MAG: hypothetical protein CSA62_11800 [Planctomycetota bacterium]